MKALDCLSGRDQNADRNRDRKAILMMEMKIGNKNI